MNYEHITQKLSETTSIEIKISFLEFENLVGCLPEESKYRKWWDNSGETPQSKAWCAAGYSVSKVIPDAYVQFIRNEKDSNSTIAPSINGGTNFESVKKEMDSYWTPGGNKTMNNSSVSSDKKMNDTGKKEDPSKACVTLGIILLILDFAIGIPALIHCLNEFEMESFFGVLIVGAIFFIIGIICIASGSPGSLGHLPSGNYHNSNDSLYYEMRDHNRRVEQLMMENENRRLQENMYRQMYESEGSLADKFDTRSTNIFRNPWDGIL